MTRIAVDVAVIAALGVVVYLRMLKWFGDQFEKAMAQQ